MQCMAAIKSHRENFQAFQPSPVTTTLSWTNYQQQKQLYPLAGTEVPRRLNSLVAFRLEHPVF
jgi:hypothetical protein